MAKDSLAQGARSATFAGGTPDVNDPIEFHGTVAVEEQEAACPHGFPTSRTCVLCSAATLDNPLAKREPKSLEELAALYEPMNDRVLLRKVTKENQNQVQLPDAYQLDSDLGIVIAVGEYMLVGGQVRPIPYKLGDKVRFGHYNAEDIEIEGEILKLVSAYDVRLKIKV